MLEQLLCNVSEHWQDLVELLAAPLSWIPQMHQEVMQFFFGASGMVSFLKSVALLFPALLWFSAVWLTGIYTYIDLSLLDYLSKNVTVRLTYASPKVGEYWRTHVSRERVRLWAVEAKVMKGWRNQMQAGAALPQQEKLWKWVRDNVDDRVRWQAL